MTAMDTDTVPQPRRRRRRNGKWPRRLLVFAAMLIGGTWIAIGSIVLFVLAQSHPLAVARPWAAMNAGPTNAHSGRTSCSRPPTREIFTGR
jgi:hypothetical protein